MTVDTDTATTVGETIAGLRRTFADGRTRSVDWRIAQLSGLERLLTEAEDTIVAALAADLGRPAAEAFIGDIGATKAETTFARKRVAKWMRPRRTRLPLTALPGRGWYQYEPLGVVLVIGPWNYPFYLTLGPLVGAIAAGNCAVVKPSEHAPRSSEALAELLPRYLDAEAVKVVEGEADVTQELLAQGLDHAFFTGGTEIGRHVMRGAANHLTPVTLELGGKSPVIVTAQADLDVAARRIAWLKLMNSGQTCIAPDYVLVERAVRNAFLERLVATVHTFRDGNAGTGMRIVDERQFGRLAGLIEGAGGEIVLGGGVDRDGLTVEPTVIADPDPGSGLMAQEIFGPVLPVLTVPTLEDAIEFVNARPKPLATYLFSRRKPEHDAVLRRTSSGGVVINHLAFHCMTPQLPFGGVGASGIGSYHGEWGFQTFSHRKAVVSKPSRPDIALLYPPYTGRKMRMIRRFF
ncbi:aldehyde dehydrogenase family protein [Amycolatopsis acidiphila]|uniref:Aldehyde dehydrogenase n=1 Tax=Amycolatopsis acidiphila TaxID=715473 RepID=A0A558AHW5_9PSEU|nr:aldehyde dehydrogenase family protein [Amycolatopsis acidiphila]TVT23855.1 aldehyde dehydrogenase family protein [Amycolatopsis acidiphila]UIJ61169.1 aldehyde dehydrogenase family protein [Amycolatopsis acidiphila]GHG86329.1 aldehyde dehydrogenase [Amycolatopsis acidiphila]